MATFERDKISLYYEESGEGFPILLFAPGGMRSSIEFWDRTPWDPRKELASDFRLIAMDQRNAGRSRAPVRASDGWHVYTADHVALLDHLGVERCHLLGGCIGGSFCLSLMQAAPERVAAAVLQQPIGLSAENREAFFAMFDAWANETRQGESGDATLWHEFRKNMYAGDFVFSVPPSSLGALFHPVLVLMGNDLYHPPDISRQVVDLMPHAELIEKWKEPEFVGEAVRRVRSFLLTHTPR